MAQYWLQTPIENAKEVVQRFIDNNIVSLPGLAGKKVSYTEQTEVIFYAGLIPSSPYQNDEIYFGTWYIATSTDANIWTTINDGSNTIDTFYSFNPVIGGHYPYIIWNDWNGLPNPPGYFVGYKFTLL